jgi:hypothetical protein
MFDPSSVEFQLVSSMLFSGMVAGAASVKNPASIRKALATLETIKTDIAAAEAVLQSNLGPTP